MRSGPGSPGGGARWARVAVRAVLAGSVLTACGGPGRSSAPIGPGDAPPGAVCTPRLEGGLTPELTLGVGQRRQLAMTYSGAGCLACSGDLATCSAATGLALSWEVSDTTVVVVRDQLLDFSTLRGGLLTMRAGGPVTVTGRIGALASTMVVRVQ